jgi:hypothetical protein
MINRKIFRIAKTESSIIAKSVLSLFGQKSEDGPSFEPLHEPTAQELDYIEADTPVGGPVLLSYSDDGDSLIVLGVSPDDRESGIRVAIDSGSNGTSQAKNFPNTFVGYAQAKRYAKMLTTVKPKSEADNTGFDEQFLQDRLGMSSEEAIAEWSIDKQVVLDFAEKINSGQFMYGGSPRIYLGKNGFVFDGEFQPYAKTGAESIASAVLLAVADLGLTPQNTKVVSSKDQFADVEDFESEAVAMLEHEFKPASSEPSNQNQTKSENQTMTTDSSKSSVRTESSNMAGIFAGNYIKVTDCNGKTVDRGVVAQVKKDGLMLQGSDWYDRDKHCFLRLS